MKARPLIIVAGLTGLAGLAGLGVVLADERCNVRVADWQPRSAVVKMAEEKGWTVRRIKTDDGCYVIQAQDQNGRDIRARIDPASLEVLATRAARERHGHDDDEDDDHGRRRGERGEHGKRGERGAAGMNQPGMDQAAPANPTAAPPENGLFKSRPQVQVQ